MTSSGDPCMSVTVHTEITHISFTSTPPLDRYSPDHPARKRVDLRRPSSDIWSTSSVDQPADRLGRLLDLATTAGRPTRPTNRAPSYSCLYKTCSPTGRPCRFCYPCDSTVLPRVVRIAASVNPRAFSP
ncbi:uncharacterized protein COLE_07585 [Cutaneotrichosporon oleaginosum]|uniref:uncharacterized protein n=1 Tax=Cutaneotrichosporon oleaginosum TaxID=879819 RepID=UPI0013266E7A|nr:hypothetical protein COLE_07585 [Cutaneotrichosporon oleaginosum]